MTKRKIRHANRNVIVFGYSFRAAHAVPGTNAVRITLSDSVLAGGQDSPDAYTDVTANGKT